MEHPDHSYESSLIFCERERLFFRECSGAAGLRRGWPIARVWATTAQASSAATFTDVYKQQKEQKRMIFHQSHPQKSGTTHGRGDNAGMALCVTAGCFV